MPHSSPLSLHSPTPRVFCAPTLLEARRAAWRFVVEQGALNALDVPLVLGRRAGASAWRDLARESSGKSALVLPRTVSPDWYFARAHGANARKRASSGLNRLWTLGKVLRALENRLEHLDFDADDTDALREMAGLVALLHRQNQPTFVFGDDAYGRELELWRAAYAEELEGMGAFDVEAAPALFPDSARANRAFEWPPILVADDLGEPLPSLAIGLEALFERARGVVATLVVAGADDELSLRARVFWEKQGAQFIECPNDAPRVAVARALLDPTASPPLSPPGNLWMWTAHTASDEAARIAGHIRRAVEEGAHASDFCLVVPDEKAQRATLRAAFAAAGVGLDWEENGANGALLLERLTRLLIPTKARDVDELHDLFGDGGLRLEWPSADGSPAARFNAGRLRRAHRVMRGEDGEAAWQNPVALKEKWEARVLKLRAHGLSHGDESQARTLTSSLDGGDLEGVARLKELLAPFSQAQSAREWAHSALSVADALAGHHEISDLDETNAPSPSEMGATEMQPVGTRLAASVSVTNGRRTQQAASLRVIEEEKEAVEEVDVDETTARGSSETDANEMQSVGTPLATSVSVTNERRTQQAAFLQAANDERQIIEEAGQQALAAFRAGVRAVWERAGDDEAPRPSGAWTAWLRLEWGHRDGASEGARYGAETSGVRVLGIGDESEAHRQGTCAVFVVGLAENAWPRPRASSSWPRGVARAIEALQEGDAPPLSRALHGFARLLACPVPLSLSRSAWMRGAESGASPLWEDLGALFPGAIWPAIPRSEATRPATRAQWLWQLASVAKEGATPSSVPLDEGLQRRLTALDSMRRERASTNELGRYDGVLGNGAPAMLRDLLPRDAEGRLVISASGAESYARCPLRFFFERVLNLPDETLAEDDLSRAESGDLVHKILFAFHRDWHAPLNQETFEQARETLARITARECDSLGLPPILRRAEAHRLIGPPARPGALVRLLRAQCREADAHINDASRALWSQPLFPLVHLAGGRIQGAHPDYANASSGQGLEQAWSLPLNGALLKGRLDRIDGSLDGTVLVVLDYKTGSASSLPSFSKGSDRLHFQLAAYVLAARQFIEGWQGVPRIAAAYLSPREGFAKWTAPPDALNGAPKSAMSEANMERWLSDSRAQIERIASLIEQGTFNLSLHPVKIARCEGCSSRGVCGQDATKQAARAEELRGDDEVFLPEAIEWS